MVFDEINGLPVHALAVHAAVVMVPLAGLLGVLFAIPRTRQWAMVPLAVVAVGAVPAVFVAKESGTKLSTALGINRAGNETSAALLVQEHAERADLLFALTIGFAVLAVVAVAVYARPNTLHAAVPAALSVLLVVGAVGVVFQTYRVGDIGAQAVWNPSGDQDYNVGD